MGDYQKRLGTDEGKVSFVQSVQEIYEHLIRSYVELGNQAQALATSETAKGQALNDLVGGRKRRRQRKKAPAADSPDSQNPLDEIFFSSNMASSIVSEPPMMAQMAISIDSAPFFPELEAPLAEEVEAPPLPRLVFHVLPGQIFCWLVLADNKVHFHKIGWTEEQLQEKIIALRDALLVDQSPLGLRSLLIRKPAQKAPAFQPLLQELYKSLLLPFENALSQIKSTLVIEAHGPLWMLPFAALEDARGKALGESFPLIYTPSHTWLTEIRKEPGYGPASELSALLVGNPTMPAPFQLAGETLAFEALSGAETEVNQLAATFGSRATRLLGAAATDSQVLAEMPKNGIIHLATHGVTRADDPLASFLIFSPDSSSEGMLQARDIFALELEAELVSLSACQTGLGQLSAEGMIGLSRAFIAAGARSVLVSLWSVSDQATSLLMQVFYREYLAGKSKAEALRQAIAAVKVQPEYAHPRYWAGFVLVGDG